MMMEPFFFYFTIFCSSFNTFHTLSLKFNVSKTLTNLSDFSETPNLPYLVMKALRHEEFWPLLLEFNRARYFNFSSVLISVLNRKFDCIETIDILSRPNFPIKELLSPDVLVGSSTCLSSMTVEALEKAGNPLESSKFVTDPWIFEQVEMFTKSGFLRGRNIDWNNVCIKTNGFEGFLGSEDFNFLFEIVNFECSKSISLFKVSELLDKMAEKLSRSFESVSSLTSSSKFSFVPSGLSKIFNAPRNEEEIDFAMKQIILVLGTAAMSLSHPVVSNISGKGREILAEHVSKLNFNYRLRFPMRKKLISFINHFLFASRTEQNFTEFSNILLKMAEFCRGAVGAPWLFNVFVLWNHFRGNLIVNDNFFTPFLEIFFAPESRASPSDVLTIYKFIERHVSGFPFGHFYAIRQFFSKHLTNRPDLLSRVFHEGIEVIPGSVKTNIDIFPMELRLAFIYKQVRRIDGFYPPFVDIETPADREKENDVWIPILKKFSLFLDLGHKGVPLNSRFRLGMYNFIGLKGLLQTFFDSLLTTPSHWWIIIRKQVSKVDLRPVLIPTLLLPPQILEIFGFALAASLSVNIKIPFVIDLEYFEIVDTAIGLSFMEQVKIFRNFRLYQVNLRKCSQIIRNYELLRHPRGKILSDVQLGTFWLKSRNSFVEETVYCTDRMLFQLLISGSSLLRTGLLNYLPTSLLHTKDLYNLLFN